MLKKINALIIASIILGSFSTTWSIPISLAIDFKDLPSNNIHYTAIQYLADKGIISGYSDKTFQPYRDVSRVEFLKLLMESSGIKTDIIQKTGFKDIDKKAWYAKYVQKAKSEGWIEGYPDNTFRPEQTINKVEGLKIIAMVQGWATKKTSELTESPFVDVYIKAWYAPYVMYAKEKNFLEERGNYFKPSTRYSRAKVSEILFRSLITRESNELSYNLELKEQVKIDNQPLPPSPISFTAPNAPKNVSITEKEVTYQTYPVDFFEDVILEESFPNIFYTNEVYSFKGTIQKENFSKAFVFLKNTSEDFESTVGEVSNNTFDIPVIFKKTGNYRLGFIIGEEGESKIVPISVVSDLPEEQGTLADSPPKNSRIEYKNGQTTFHWETDISSISKLLINQGSQSKTYFFRQTSQPKHSFSIDYKDFQDWHTGTTNFQIQTAKSTQTKPISIQSKWTEGATIAFEAAQHNFRELHDDLITWNQLPEIMSAPGFINFSGTAKSDIFQEAVITRPDGLVESTQITSLQPTQNFHSANIIPDGNSYTFTYSAQQKGIYILEINGTNGSALLNFPVYVQTGIPFIPDFFDLTDSTILEKNVSVNIARNELLNLINQERGKIGLANIKADTDLNLLSQNYAEDMANRDFFGHINPEGLTPNDRRLALQIPTEVGENLAKAPSTTYAHQGLIRSPIHRKNIINPKWERVGIGIAQNPDGELFFVEEFSTYPLTPEKLEVIKNSFRNEINAKRAGLNLSPLESNINIEKVAQEWSTMMVDQDFFEFTAPDGTTFSSIVQKAITSESVQALILESNQEEKIQEELLESNNSLNPIFTSLGIGLAVDKTGVLKLTAIYSK